MGKRLSHWVGWVLVSGLALTSVVQGADPRLVGWWKLDEASGRMATDSSGYGNHGTVNGNVMWVPGIFNGALQFDGYSTWVDCGSDASLELPEAVTITAWIKMHFAGGDRKIAGNQDDGNGGYKFGVYENNRVEFEVRSSTNYAILNRTSPGGTPLQPGAWYHVAGVYSRGQGIRTYVNGLLDRELITDAVAGSSAGSFKLGREPFTNLYYWLGALDDVAVFSAALTESEIQTLMLGLELQPPAAAGGPATEDFESGDFSKCPWVQGGNLDWQISPLERHLGLDSATSGPIADDESSVLKVTLTCINGDITFCRKVSSESGCDYLVFLIDGVERERWSGQEDWAEVTFSVTRGTHVFEWVYTKDGSVSTDADAAWIDDIVFPSRGVAAPNTGPIILDVVRADGQGDSRPPIGPYDGDTSVLPTEAGGLRDGTLCYSDRMYPWSRTPASLAGAEYVRTFNSDKKSWTVAYTVTTSRAATVMITVDDRIYDRQGAANLATMRFAVAGTFTDTGLNLYVHEDTLTDRAQSVFSARLPAGTYVFSSMPSEYNFYIIAAMD